MIIENREEDLWQVGRGSRDGGKEKDREEEK